MKKLMFILLCGLAHPGAFGQTALHASARQDTIRKEEVRGPEEYIKQETIGGKLDFNKVLESEKQSLFLYEGVAYNKKDFAIYLWGRKVQLLGLDSKERATRIWQELYHRDLTGPEKKALATGFNSKAK